MARKNSVALMVQGLGLAMEFIRLLTTKVVEKGGVEEMIHFLTTNRGTETLDRIADVIVKAPWQVPLSLIERLAYEKSLEWCDLETAEHDRKNNWMPALQELGIPFLAFADQQDGWGDGRLAFPEQIVDQLRGKEWRYPQLVNYDGNEYVVCQSDFKEGQVIDDNSFAHTLLAIVERKFIDLSR